MPEAPAAPPPAAPVTPPAPALPPASPPATDHGPGSEIHVTPGSVDGGPKPTPPKKGSVREQVFEELRKRAKPQFFESAPEPESPAQPSPDAAKSSERAAPGTPAEKAAGDTSLTPAATPEEKKAKSPWKLVDEYKARVAKAETEISELRKGTIPPEERKQIDQRISELQKQNEELEKEIRYVNYAKSNEFKIKYQEPYEKAWARAAKEVSEIIITDGESGERRAATTKDLYGVVVAPLSEARDLADSVFGKFADDVMQYRKEIRALNDLQETALKEAHETAVQREKQNQQEAQTFLTQTAGEIQKIWEHANQEFGERPDLAFVFKPGETDEDHKSRLAKGYELVDKAFAVNATDPRLTPEKRAEAVKMHAAVRMRAAGFGPLRHLYDSAQKKIAALEKELSEYKQTVPATGGTSGADNSPPRHATGWDNIRAGLQKIAKPQ